MSQVKTPIELWQELRDLVMDLEKDANKATRGMRAGGVRLRTDLQKVRDLAMDMRKAILDYRADRKRKKSHKGEDVGESIGNDHGHGGELVVVVGEGSENGNGHGSNGTGKVKSAKTGPTSEKRSAAKGPARAAKPAPVGSSDSTAAKPARVAFSSAPQAAYKQPGKNGLITEATICQALGASVSELVDSITATTDVDVSPYHAMIEAFADTAPIESTATATATAEEESGRRRALGFDVHNRQQPESDDSQSQPFWYSNFSY